MENNISIVKAEHITKNFNRLKVLDNVSLSLEKGKITCVLGPSGCGKSTLLKIIAGLEKPSKGEIVTDISLPGKAAGYMSQEDSLLPWKTAEQNVSLAMELVGINNHRQAMKMLRMVHLSRFFRFYPSELSGGQRQRVSLARMLSVTPKILLLDEPFSALDIVVKNELATIIRNYVSEHQAAALMITHSVEEALLIADQVVILSPCPAHVSEVIDVSDNERNNLFARVKTSLEKSIREKKCAISS